MFKNEQMDFFSRNDFDTLLNNYLIGYIKKEVWSPFVNSKTIKQNG